MAKVKLLEKASPKQKIIKEDNGDIFIEGVFAVYDKVNLNGRRYPKSVMESAVNLYNEQYVNNRRSHSELDHPETRSDPWLSESAIFIKEPLVLKEGGEVFGRAKVLCGNKNFPDGTPKGKILAYLIDEGISVGISTRGLGELVEVIEESSDGESITISEVADYEINAFDVVGTPSSDYYVDKSGKVKPKSDVVKESKQLDILKLVELLND